MKHICAVCRHKPITLTMRATLVFTTVSTGSRRLEELPTFAVIASSIQSSPGSADGECYSTVQKAQAMEESCL